MSPSDTILLLTLLVAVAFGGIQIGKWIGEKK